MGRKVKAKKAKNMRSLKNSDHVVKDEKKKVKPGYFFVYAFSNWLVG